MRSVTDHIMHKLHEQHAHVHFKKRSSGGHVAPAACVQAAGGAALLQDVHRLVQCCTLWDLNLQGTAALCCSPPDTYLCERLNTMNVSGTYPQRLRAATSTSVHIHRRQAAVGLNTMVKTASRLPLLPRLRQQAVAAVCIETGSIMWCRGSTACLCMPCHVCDPRNANVQHASGNYHLDY